MNCKKSIARLTAVMTAVLLFATLCGCGPSALSITDFTQADTYTVPENAFWNDLDPQLDTTKIKATEEQLAALATLTVLCETDEATLYQGTAYDVILLDKRTNSLLYSNPGVYTDTEQTEEQKKLSYSQIIIEYYNNDGVTVQATSYPDCYNGGDKNQVTVEKTKTGAAFTYQFGEDTTAPRIYFSGMRVETLEELEEKSEQLIADGAISKTEWQRFKGLYLELEWKKLSQAEQSKYSALYPNFQTYGTIYAMQDNITSVQLKVMEKVAKAAGVTLERVEEENIALGGADAVVTSAVSFRMTVNYMLDGADLIVSVDKSTVEESKNGRISRVILVPELMSASGKGYSFLPDGSGALIDHSMQENSSGECILPFYGVDYSLAIKTADETEVSALFPVAGIHNENDRAVFAIAESGAATGGVTASPASSSRNHNAVHLWFTTRAIDSRESGGDIKRENQYIFADPDEAGIFAVRFHQLYGSDSDYNGMARYYRTYLKKTGVLKDNTQAVKQLLDVEMLGAIRDSQIKFGIPVDASVALSTYEDIRAWMNSVKEAGIDSVEVSLSGWFNGGIEQGLFGEIEPEDGLGDLEALSTLCKTAAEYGYTLYPAVDPLQVASNGFGLKQGNHLSQMLNQDFSKYYVYSPSTRKPNTQFDVYLLHPVYLMDRTNIFVDNYKQVTDSVLVTSVGDMLYGSYEDNAVLNRDRAAQLVGDALGRMQESGLSLKISGGHLYALAHASGITDLPVKNSGNRLFTASVPFAGMVLHGALPYSGSLLNTASDYEKALLQNLESGAAFRFQLMTGDPLMLAQTKHNGYYASAATEWQDDILAINTRFSELYTAISGKTIEKHTRIDSELVCVEYENGVRVYINYSESEKTIDGQTIGAMDFAWQKGG